MEQQQFNLRFDGPTLAALKRLARATQRSQAGVIRWLILAEAEKLSSQPGQVVHKTQEVVQSE